MWAAHTVLPDEVGWVRREMLLPNLPILQPNDLCQQAHVRSPSGYKLIKQTILLEPVLDFEKLAVGAGHCRLTTARRLETKASLYFCSR